MGSGNDSKPHQSREKHGKKQKMARVIWLRHCAVMLCFTGLKWVSFTGFAGFRACMIPWWKCLPADEKNAPLKHECVSEWGEPPNGKNSS
jgi:hypothetical protein